LHPRAVEVPSQSRIYLLGGFAKVDGGTPPKSALSEVLEYNPASDQLTPAGALPSPRTWGAAAHVPSPSAIYYLGGSTHSEPEVGTQVFDTILKYDVGNHQAVDTGLKLPRKLARVFAAHFPADDCLYLFGGLDDTFTATRSIIRFCPAAGTVVEL